MRLHTSTKIMFVVLILFVAAGLVAAMVFYNRAKNLSPAVPSTTTSTPPVSAQRSTTTQEKTTIPATTTPSASEGRGCKITGCSSELCLSEKDAEEQGASICIWQDKFACFKTAKCEVQKNGQCGWTQTEELKTCLAKNP